MVSQHSWSNPLGTRVVPHNQATTLTTGTFLTSHPPPGAAADWVLAHRHVVGDIGSSISSPSEGWPPTAPVQPCKLNNQSNSWQRGWLQLGKPSGQFCQQVHGRSGHGIRTPTATPPRDCSRGRDVHHMSLLGPLGRHPQRWVQRAPTGQSGIPAPASMWQPQARVAFTSRNWSMGFGQAEGGPHGQHQPADMVENTAVRIWWRFPTCGIPDSRASTAYLGSPGECWCRLAILDGARAGKRVDGVGKAGGARSACPEATAGAVNKQRIKPSADGSARSAWRRDTARPRQAASAGLVARVARELRPMPALKSGAVRADRTCTAAYGRQCAAGSTTHSTTQCIGVRKRERDSFRRRSTRRRRPGRSSPWRTRARSAAPRRRHSRMRR